MVRLERKQAAAAKCSHFTLGTFQRNHCSVANFCCGAVVVGTCFVWHRWCVALLLASVVGGWVVVMVVVVVGC